MDIIVGSTRYVCWGSRYQYNVERARKISCPTVHAMVTDIGDIKAVVLTDRCLFWLQALPSMDPGSDFAPGSLQHILHSMHSTDSVQDTGAVKQTDASAQQTAVAHDSVADVLQCAAAEANGAGVRPGDRANASSAPGPPCTASLTGPTSPVVPSMDMHAPQAGPHGAEEAATHHIHEMHDLHDTFVPVEVEYGDPMGTEDAGVHDNDHFAAPPPRPSSAGAPVATGLQGAVEQSQHTHIHSDAAHAHAQPAPVTQMFASNSAAATGEVAGDDAAPSGEGDAEGGVFVDVGEGDAAEIEDIDLDVDGGAEDDATVATDRPTVGGGEGKVGDDHEVQWDAGDEANQVDVALGDENAHSE